MGKRISLNHAIRVCLGSNGTTSITRAR